MAKMERGKFDAALEEFSAYENRLSGNPNTIYYKGFCLEKMERKKPAAEEYQRYLQQAPDGEFSAYVQKRLVEWGYSVQ
jgi:tetratricopeptide (TPR) repeat protein